MERDDMESGSQVADVVAGRIESLIVDGVLKPGQALPSERRLTVKLGVSRSALREGLKVLRARKIIETSHGRGSFVAALTSQPALSPMMHLLGSQPRTLYDIFEVREMLEAESARLAALRGTQADYALITRRYEEMLAANNSPDIGETKRARLDYAFHLAICEASHNPVLVHTLTSLTDLLLSSVFASVNNLYHRTAEKRVIDRQHARLYKAVTGKQPEQARRAASAHIATTTACLREIDGEEQRLVRATLRLNGWE
ncbi:transcriptional regulator GlcC [Paraburkholderia phenoliruptrix]|uniref:GntR domain protein n=1 Tax=Burkholderia sp. (strain CCGE1003) TaxID=640512 RepID=E1THY9_BURSG|nr:transcriptional regulator GlcC [Paraburkholderia phenoliruptrix]MBW0447067.1 transcriptional regulator GlcC [Paraburkholderia phenoliruptrix]MBW9101077.1 transcriptional regulator GlcC [Paraburkholderia phenoliruptrix]MBW9105443.1 transcriptional regulator GlcC [Paraburkholderia phenoliruptrix]MBW9130063.1 transcriptional regulator GlcC [Paraburkholderia ginsengiterrae]